MNQDFDHFFAALDDFFSPRSFSRGTFKLDLQETAKEYLVEAELPGVQKEEVDLDFNEGRLTIAVQRNEEVEETNKNYVHRERRSHSMSRGVYLPDANPEGMKAKLDQGILTISVQKQEKKPNNYKINLE